jgi:hypothetical protein
VKLNRTLVILGALVGAHASAQPLPYAQSRTTINAGTLLIESQRIGAGPGVPANIAPHVWFNLDQDATSKPASWTFDNPLGQTQLTADSRNRWLNTPGAGAIPPAGSQLGKAQASYWEVHLMSVSDATLAQFDVLNLTVNGVLSLNSIEREKLRNFVDQGGVLWIDLVNDAGLVLDLANGAPYGFDWIPSALAVDANLSHPLMSSPNPIRLYDLEAMAYQGAPNPIVTRPFDLTGSGVGSLLSWVTPDSRRLEPIAGNTDGRTVSAAQLGEGYIVVTSRGVTATLNRGVIAIAPPPRTPQPNRAFLGLAPVFDDAHSSAAKFAINVISLATNYSTAGSGSRKSSSSAVTVDAPMLRRFVAPFGGGSFDPGKPAVIFKGYIVTTAGGRVTVFDADPNRDIDRNGDPDDGIPDPLGVGTDVIWQSVPLPGRLSVPTVVEAPDTGIGDPSTGFLATNQIWLTDDQSRVYIFNLDSAAGAAIAPLAPSPIAPPAGEAPTVDPAGPYAPTVHESLVVVSDSRAVDNLGRVWLIDLNSGTRVSTALDWSLRNIGQFAPSGASATVGYIPVEDNPGGLDRVIYVPQQPTTFGTPRPASLTSFWLGARGEQPVRVSRISPTQVRVTTRASQQGLPLLFAGPSSSLGLKVTLINPNTGNPFTLADMQTIFTGNVINPGSRGEFIAELTAAPGGWDFDGTMTPGNATDDVGWRVDYTIDWGQAGAFGGPSPQSYVRGNLEFPDTVANTRRIVGGAALGPNGNVFVATSAPGAGDIGSTLFNLKEIGRGDFRLVYRYDLYDQLTFNMNQGTTPADQVNLPPAFVDQDILLQDLPFLNAPIRNLKFVGGPAVRGNTVYLIAAGQKLIGVHT